MGVLAVESLNASSWFLRQEVSPFEERLPCAHPYSCGENQLTYAECQEAHYEPLCTGKRVRNRRQLLDKASTQGHEAGNALKCLEISVSVLMNFVIKDWLTGRAIVALQMKQPVGHAFAARKSYSASVFAGSGYLLKPTFKRRKRTWNVFEEALRSNSVSGFSNPLKSLNVSACNIP